MEGILDKFMKRFRFLTFDEKTNERLQVPNYFTAPFVAAYLEWYTFCLFLLKICTIKFISMKTWLRVVFISNWSLM